MSTKSVLGDFRSELEYAQELKEAGRTEVHSLIAGPKLAKGRTHVPIGEYISHWQQGITAMEAGAPEEQFAY